MPTESITLVAFKNVHGQLKIYVPTQKNTF